MEPSQPVYGSQKKATEILRFVFKNYIFLLLLQKKKVLGTKEQREGMLKGSAKVVLFAIAS